MFNQNLRVRLLAVVVAFGCLLGCSDKGVEPVPPVDYLVYFAVTERPVIFSYNPSSGVLDSIVIPFIARVLKVTPDGKELHISSYDSTVILDLTTRQTISSGPRVGVVFSRDGKLYARIDANLPEPLQILRRSDDSVIFSDTFFVHSIHFSEDNKRIYGVTSGSRTLGGTGKVYTANLEGNPDIKLKSFNGSVQWIIPSPDESKWFLYEGIFDFFWSFEVYDVAGDSIMFSAPANPGYGDMKMTPDGSYVFFTAPGPVISRLEPPSLKTIPVFDVAANHITTEITTSILNITDSGSFISEFPVGRIAATADGRWLVGLGIFQGILTTIDAGSLTVKETIKIGSSDRLFWITTQME